MIRVLIVDDSVFMRTVLTDIIGRDQSMEIVGTASDGREALEKIAELSPDVITLDIQMPVMDGIATLEALAKRNSPSKMKILVLSTLTSKDAELTHRALKLGADDFMLKPRNLGKVRAIGDELITKIRHLITIPTIGKKSHSVDKPADRVVLIGSSAGGPPMLDTLVSALDPDLNAAVVITQHMPVGFTAALAERLNRISPMSVKETENGDVLKSGQVYVSKGGYHTVISGMLAQDGSRGGRITHSKSPALHAVRPAVDKTFESGAKVFGSNVLSVILSGMGSDGGEGALAVKAHGGRTIVVKEEDCLVYGMARSALERDAVDKVLPLSRISREIGKIMKHMEGRYD